MFESDGSVRAPRSRSELLAARRAETSHALQSRYNEWEAANPAWARRLTGPAAAAALGYGKGAGSAGFASRSDMLHARKIASREASMRASGFDEPTQKKLTSFEPNTLTTSISRATVDPSLLWREDPPVRSRSQLRDERRLDNVRTLDAATERNEREGVLGAEARVQRRIDQNIVFLQGAPKGKSRAELIEQRKAERAKASLDAYTAYSPPMPPQFSAQEEPFWKLQREQGDGREPRAYGTSTEAATKGALQMAAKRASAEAARVTATLPADDPAVTSANALAVHTASVANAPSSASAPELLPNGSQSLEMLKARQRWWSKPDVYPSVTPAQPRTDDPFKLAATDTTYLHRKLTSGPKKAQRGYPPETRHVTDKMTSMPPPPLAEAKADDPRMAPFRQYTGASFKFMPSEPREVLPGQDQTVFDGYEFTQPLYSSFAADKTFQPAHLPPRPVPRNGRGGTAVRERARPATTSGSRVETGGRELPHSAPNGPSSGGLRAFEAARPGTAAMGALRG